MKATDCERHCDAEDGEEDDDLGDEYILGTMLVRVLQARDVKSIPNNQDGGIAGFLLNHRRNRHQRSTASPASAGWGGSLTPSSPFGNPQIYAKLSYKGLSQLTSMAIDHSVSGDYHWSRSDQSYFDVTCPGLPLKMNTAKAKQIASSSDASCVKPSKEIERSKKRKIPPRRRPPILHLSLYSKKGGGSAPSHKHGRWPFGGDSSIVKDHDRLLGRCSINVLRILCGKTPYFDEWCALHHHNDGDSRGDRGHRVEDAGRVRIVIEYEPTDPPPRPGDTCVFANVHPLAGELYPIAPYSIREGTGRSHAGKSLTCRPKTYRVEEVVGDNVVLSYQTSEGWQCTFEVHRYLLLCVERYQGAVEKYREQVLDLCDNLSQSPAVEVLAKTMETLPDEGLIHVGVELVGASLGLLGRWWETGLDGVVEDLVDSTNLDGRYSHFSDDEEERVENGADVGAQVQQLLPPKTNHLTEASRDERKPIPGMPCCPITGQQMIEPVVAADGHTYERYAIARWLETSSRSPLTGEIFAHNKLVPNYLLLSSLGNEVKREDVVDKSAETLDVL
ncbi:hypothetical protein ACHAW5_004800 [Stephanodiscus triporus]|uniref:U-box domain-containing protein n=1 Tax=Stephanodiscus triporus TaxID=2934178 RepID=A0ABD3MKD5_9STRA